MNPLPPFTARFDDVEVTFPRSWEMGENGVARRVSGSVALENITCEFPAGQITGLLGRNGAGKSTMLSLLAAFRRPTRGAVLVGPDGDLRDPWEDAALTSAVLVVQEGGDVLQDEKVEATFSYYADLRPDWDPEYARELLDLFEVPLRKKASVLSRGKRSALAATLGLAARAPLTVFDEVYLGMDAPTRFAFYDALLADYAEHPRTIVMSSHLVEETERLFENVVLLDRGRVVLAEPADDLRTRVTSLTGPTAAVDHLAAGRDVLHRQHLGPTTRVTVHGPLSDDDARAAAAAGVTIGHEGLEGLLIHLTRSSREGTGDGGTTAGRPLAGKESHR
ncbi:ATP-binding cassette domain-containing protein [Myceligenerans pegani]|uniref:ABC transporter ATP-binding protein n=1 Tax=Myceligenerans pegani TaxID=2776917 RepID=A0ABR9MWA5_9MICO|nr:ATP-binding cassette domain-containing protein [Myceligenerans sp. TRM 65318]MBE1875062.1 ABC transporter ATP-binding protein [Myceligenerans sp. TRM 65318]MBE3017333.1 ABC transporter ATP-binding protein [Myceligenerans sp. TRM 65318]